ncbi:MAG: 23S rRNA (pseudouridine(1915)-N(3))-methyltransferase RlmH [Alphaproteobacteria bacterium]|nr:23S rRNA (pseudouridine(1915)-N(3))-methyltransferase RlmH [Alphaproteobacteria bacterium]
MLLTSLLPLFIISKNKTGKKMKVTIIAIGKCKKNSPEAEIIAEYIKRSGWQICIKEADNSTQAEEAKFLQGAIPAGAKVIVLDERGENLKSLELAQKVENWQINGCSEICFLIGGADGHLPETRQRADLLLSFGKLTLPHILMRAVLAEQIYRIQTIINHHPYHRE